MRLNKFQRRWINKLKSGTTRKAKNTLLQEGGSKCCLGVAISECGLEELKLGHIAVDIDSSHFPNTAAILRLQTSSGSYNPKLVKGKWAKDSRVKTYCSLMSLNDDTNMTHKEIGEFIDANRELIFC